MNLSEYEMEQITQAAKILTEDLKFYTPIPQLANKVGLNERKLKAGFKLRFNKGVFAYYNDARMKKATEMLLEERSLSYIARSIGFLGEKAESNFGRAFRNQFNETPASWAKKHKKKNNSNMLV